MGCRIRLSTGAGVGLVSLGSCYWILTHFLHMALNLCWIVLSIHLPHPLLCGGYKCFLFSIIDVDKCHCEIYVLLVKCIEKTSKLGFRKSTSISASSIVVFALMFRALFNIYRITDSIYSDVQ